MKPPTRSHTPMTHSLRLPTTEGAAETMGAAGETALRSAPQPAGHPPRNMSMTPHSQSPLHLAISHCTSPDTTHRLTLQNPPRYPFDPESEGRRDPTCRSEGRSTLALTLLSHLHRLHQRLLLLRRPLSMRFHRGRKIAHVVGVRIEGDFVPQTTTRLLPSSVRFGTVAVLQRDLGLLVRRLLDRS